MVPGGSGDCFPLKDKRKDLASDLNRKMDRKETNKHNTVLRSMSNGCSLSSCRWIEKEEER